MCAALWWLDTGRISVTGSQVLPRADTTTDIPSYFRAQDSQSSPAKNYGHNAQPSPAVDCTCNRMVAGSVVPWGPPHHIYSRYIYSRSFLSLLCAKRLDRLVFDLTQHGLVNNSGMMLTKHGRAAENMSREQEGSLSAQHIYHPNNAFALIRGAPGAPQPLVM